MQRSVVPQNIVMDPNHVMLYHFHYYEDVVYIVISLILPLIALK